MIEPNKKTKLFIEKAIKKHGDKYDYSKVKYNKAIEKVIIICKKHGEFQQISTNHIRGNGCNKCAIENNHNNKKSNTEEFIQTSKEYHGDKYDYSKVVYDKSNIKVIIICKKHGEFKQRPGNHLNGQGCKKCGKVYSPTTNEFIENAINIHGDKYDYSKVKYNKAIEKVIIICKEHGEFLQQPCSHLNGQGCKKCGIELSIEKRKINIEEIIEKAITLHGDKYDYSKVEFIKMHEKVIIICKKHGEYNQILSDHLSGHGCNKCGIEKNANNCRSNTAEFIKKATKIHGDKYDYSKIEYINSMTKIIIICSEHEEFEQTPSQHLSGHGCNKCAIEISIEKRKSNTAEFIKKATKIHGNKYDYSKVEYNKSQEQIIIICKEHGEFLQQPCSHLSGCGCKKCGIELSIEKRKSNTCEFIEKAITLHGDKYDYSKIEYINSMTKIIIICPEHEEFEQTPSHHLSGHGCNKCAIENNTENLISNTREFIEKATNKHGDKYNYSKVYYINCKTQVIIICSKHNEFLQRPDYHLKSNGCPKCYHTGYSKISIQYLDFISKYNNIFIQHAENVGEHIIQNTNYRADGYCEETNTIYEYHGDFWHGNPDIFCGNETNKITKCTYGELYQKTLEREQQIRDFGYNLVVMWEHDWNKINKSIRTLQRKFKSLH
jgi:hypothetical protein